MTFSASDFAKRRADLMAKMGKYSIAIVPGHKEQIRSADQHFPFRQNSDFYYLTGFNEPDAIAVLIPGRAEGEYILFNRSRDPGKEIWDGYRAGQAGAVEIYQANQSYPIESFSALLPELLLGKACLWYPIGRDPELDKLIASSVHDLAASARRGTMFPSEFINVETDLHEMRLFKDPKELELMRKAAQISVEAHLRAMKVCRPGKFEYELEAEFFYKFRSHNAVPAYPCIIASGKNACTLHHIENSSRFNEGELVLVDAGAELGYYASDITRTLPINGSFSQEQKIIYEIVLKAQQAAINAVKPGTTLEAIHDISVRHLTEGLIEIGLLKGQLDDLITEKKYKAFFMHGTSHWLGLDTHDVGRYRLDDGSWRKLEPGMAFTVEPGLYITALPDVDKRWHHIGVRIEDDVVVTKTGCEVLTGALPKTVSEIESIMKA